MKLTFLKRKVRGNRAQGAKLTASLNIRGHFKLSNGSAKEFDLDNNFLYGKLATNKGLRGFYFVEVTDEHTIKTDTDVAKLGPNKKFAFSELLDVFKDNFPEGAKQIVFSVEQRRILEYNTLQFTLMDN